MPYTTVIRLPVVVGNPANGFPARLLGAKGSKLATCTWMRRPGKFMDMQLTVGQRCRWDRCVRPPAYQETDGTGARALRLSSPPRPREGGFVPGDLYLDIGGGG